MNAAGGRPAEAAGGAFAPLLAGGRSLAPPELLDSGGRKRLLGRAERLPRSVADTSFSSEFHLAAATAAASAIAAYARTAAKRLIQGVPSPEIRVRRPP